MTEKKDGVPCRGRFFWPSSLQWTLGQDRAKGSNTCQKTKICTLADCHQALFHYQMKMEHLFSSQWLNRLRTWQSSLILCLILSPKWIHQLPGLEAHWSSSRRLLWNLNPPSFIQPTLRRLFRYSNTVGNHGPRTPFAIFTNWNRSKLLPGKRYLAYNFCYSRG